jgi:hypothetical protein
MAWCMSSFSFNMQHQILSRGSKVRFYHGMFCVLSLALTPIFVDDNISYPDSFPLLQYLQSFQKILESVYTLISYTIFLSVFQKSRRPGSCPCFYSARNYQILSGDPNCKKKGKCSVSRVWLNIHLYGFSICHLSSAPRYRKLSKDFASAPYLHHSDTLPSLVQNLLAKRLWYRILPLVSICSI